MSVELRGVGKSFGEVVALQPVDLVVADRELLVLLGPSGCGKSTLLRLVAGLEEPSQGEVWIGGRRVDDVDPKDRDVAMVFQGYALYPHRTVRGNLAYPLERRGGGRAERAERVRETARALGLEALLDRRPGELSGGERQRVAMGRALVRRPRVFLFDEPLSNLDARLRGELRGEIARLHASAGTTSLYVTHDQVEAMALGDRVAVLRAGRVEQVGTPREIYDRPASRFVAEFVGSPPMNLLPAARDGDRFATGPLSVPAPADAPDRVVLGVRPEHLQPAGPSPFRVERVEHFGPDAHVHCAAGPVAVVARLAATQAPAAGAEIGLCVDDPAHVHRFDPKSGARLS